jgi:hypothetical protein
MRFGYLTVIKPTGKSTPRGIVWLVRCERCGKLSEKISVNIMRPQGDGPPKSCGCVLREARPHKYKGVGDLCGERWANQVKGATRRGLPVTITVQEAYAVYERQGGRCALTGVPLQMVRLYDKNKHLHTASLDRIDSSKGYTTDNIQWVHKDINYIKQSLTEEKFIHWCRRLVQYADKAGLMVGHEFGLAKHVKGRPGYEHLRDVPVHQY